MASFPVVYDLLCSNVFKPSDVAHGPAPRRNELMNGPVDSRGPRKRPVFARPSVEELEGLYLPNQVLPILQSAIYPVDYIDQNLFGTNYSSTKPPREGQEPVTRASWTPSDTKARKRCGT